MLIVPFSVTPPNCVELPCSAFRVMRESHLCGIWCLVRHPTSYSLCEAMTAPAQSGTNASEPIAVDGATRRVTIGVLALQGAFVEHAALLASLGADVREVRLPQEFEGLDGIVLPGGESTAMALIGERWGVFPRLKQWVKEGRPVWGTCAGMILLSDHALMMKKGGQALVGGLNVEICRNYFGAQKSSFEVPLDTSALGLGGADEKGGEESSLGPYPAVFIRAPAILEVGPGVDVLCKVRARPCNKAVNVMTAQLQAQAAAEKEEGVSGAGGGDEGDEAPSAKRRRLAAFFVESDSTAAGADGAEAPEVIVAIRKGNIVGTSFHPELTNDTRWHKYFVELVKEAVDAGGGGEPSASAKGVGTEVVPAVA